MMSPMSDRTVAVRQRMMSGYFRIPENCYDSPLEPEGNDHGYVIDNGALLAMTLPNLECRTPQNRRQLQEVGPDGRRLMILLSGYGPAVSETSRRDETFEWQYIRDSCQNGDRDGPASCYSNSYRKISENQTEIFGQYRMRYQVTGRDIIINNKIDGRWMVDISVPVDVYRSKAGLSFAICSHSYRGRRETRSVTPPCKLVFRYRDMLVQATFGRSQLPRRWKLEQQIRAWLDHYRREEP
jgi:hypothetical protein